MKVADIPQSKRRKGAKLLTVRMAEAMSSNIPVREPDDKITRHGVTTSRHRHPPVIHQGTLVEQVSTGDVVKARERTGRARPACLGTSTSCADSPAGGTPGA